MATTRFYLDLRGKAKDGKGSLLISLSHNGGVTSIPTGIRIAADEWNKQKQRVIKHPNAAVLNANLADKKSKVDKAILLLSMDEGSFSTMTAAELRQAISTEKKPRQEKHRLAAIFAEYMELGNLKENTLQMYRSTLKRLSDFGGSDISLEDISLRWMLSFDCYLSRFMNINGKAVYFRALRSVLNYAKHNGIQFYYPFDTFQIKTTPTQKRAIPVDLLRKFRDYPTTEKNAVFRDYFFLMFYLIGINTKDLLLAKKSQVVDGRFEYVREKTRKKYSIKIEPEAEALLERYKGKGDNLLEAMDHCKHYRSFAREINDALKTIGDTIVDTEYVPDNLFATQKKTIEPVIPEITTYHARHSWATYAYEIGYPMDVISQALGHSFGNKTTLIYVKPDQSKVDAANRAVIDYLLYQDLRMTSMSPSSP